MLNGPRGMRGYCVFVEKSAWHNNVTAKTTDFERSLRRGRHIAELLPSYYDNRWRSFQRIFSTIFLHSTLFGYLHGRICHDVVGTF